jgi:hypothetical protein
MASAGIVDKKDERKKQNRYRRLSAVTIVAMRRRVKRRSGFDAVC